MHKQKGSAQWAACSEVEAIMRQMSGYWSPEQTGAVGGLCRLSPSPSPSLFSFASHGLSLILTLLQTCECEDVKTHLHTHTPPPPPLLLIIPLQIHRSISSTIIVCVCVCVPPAAPLRSSSPFKSGKGGGEKLAFEPLSASLAGVSRFSHSLPSNHGPALRQGPIR